MKNVLLALCISCFLLTSCTSQPKRPTANPAVAGMIEDLKTKKIAYELDPYGFPFKKGEFIVSFDNKSNANRLTKAKDNLIKVFRDSLKIDKAELVPLKCNCDNFTFILQTGGTTGAYGDGDVLRPVTKITGDGWEAVPNYFTSDGSPKAQNISYHSPRNAYIQALTARSNPRIGTSERENSKKVKIAFLDSGIDYTKPLLKPYLVASPTLNCYPGDLIGYSFVRENSVNVEVEASPNVYDRNGHGTHVASNIVQMSEQLDHKNISIIPVKIMNTHGYGTLASAICGLNYAITRKVQIINNSWGIAASIAPNDFTVLKDIMERCKNENILVVNAAGNDNQVLTTSNNYQVYPAMFGGSLGGFSNSITVAGFELKDLLGSSNRGDAYVEIAADGLTSVQIGTTTFTARGTSFAAPLVSATAAKFGVSGWGFSNVKTYLANPTNSVSDSSLSGKVQNNNRLTHTLP